MKKEKGFQMSFREWIFEGGKTVLLLTVWGILFFHSFAGVFFLFPYGIWMMVSAVKRCREKRRKEIRMDFKEVVLSMAASLQAGYTLEQSVELAREELLRLYPKGNRAMIEELEWMINGMKVQMPVEELVKALAERSGVEEIRSFGTVLSVAKRQGGNLVKISRNTAEHISKKIQTEQQADQILAGKVFEKNIMVWMPYLILIYLEVTNRGYLDVLYQDWTGRGIMTVCLTAVIAAGEWADRIVGFYV